MELAKIRPSDIVLTVLLALNGVALMIGNIQAGPHSDVRIDSHSWWMVPVFTLAMLPVLLRSTSVLAVTAASTVAMGVHDVAFDHVIRCGAGLPLSFVLAYSLGRAVHHSRNSQYVGLGFVVTLQVATLIWDTAAGIGILPFTAIIAVAAYGVGAFVRTRTESATATSPELTYA